MDQGILCIMISMGVVIPLILSFLIIAENRRVKKHAKTKKRRRSKL